MKKTITIILLVLLSLTFACSLLPSVSPSQKQTNTPSADSIKSGPTEAPTLDTGSMEPSDTQSGALSKSELDYSIGIRYCQKSIDEDTVNLRSLYAAMLGPTSKDATDSDPKETFKIVPGWDSYYCPIWIESNISRVDARFVLEEEDGSKPGDLKPQADTDKGMYVITDKGSKYPVDDLSYNYQNSGIIEGYHGYGFDVIPAGIPIVRYSDGNVSANYAFWFMVPQGMKPAQIVMPLKKITLDIHADGEKKSPPAIDESGISNPPIEYMKYDDSAGQGSPNVLKLKYSANPIMQDNYTLGEYRRPELRLDISETNLDKTSMHNASLSSQFLLTDPDGFAWQYIGEGFPPGIDPGKTTLITKSFMAGFLNKPDYAPKYFYLTLVDGDEKIRTYKITPAKP